MPREQRPTVESVARKLASEWARRAVAKPSETRHDTSATELELAGTVLLELAAEVEELRQRASDNERLARDLGFDMLYALETAYNEGDVERGMLYLVRGWKRDKKKISAADCTEAHELEPKLPDTSSVD